MLAPVELIDVPDLPWPLRVEHRGGSYAPEHDRPPTRRHRGRAPGRGGRFRREQVRELGGRAARAIGWL
jgi:hypothetical protein